MNSAAATLAVRLKLMKLSSAARPGTCTRAKNCGWLKQWGGSGLQGGAGKAVVMGMLQRGGKVVASVIPDRTKASMQPVILGNVDPGSEIHSDEHGEHWRMDDEYLH